MAVNIAATRYAIMTNKGLLHPLRPGSTVFFSLNASIASRSQLPGILPRRRNSRVGLLAGAAVSLVNPAIAFALVAGVIGAVLLARDAQWGMAGVMAVCTLLPFAAVPLNVGFSPTFLDLVTVMLVAVWFAQMATGRSALAGLARPLDLPLLLFLALAFFSFIVGLSFAGLSVMTLRHFAEIIFAIGLYFAW